MDQHTYVITFRDASSAEANRYASELENVILDASPDVSVERQHTESNTQDFGATLVLALGTSAAVAVAKGIADWLRRRNTATIDFQDGDKKVSLTGITSANAAEIIEYLTKSR